MKTVCTKVAVPVLFSKNGKANFGDIEEKHL